MKHNRIEQIKNLITRLDHLMALTSGPRHYTYKLRRHQAELAMKAIKRSMKSKPGFGGRIPYVTNAKGLQGGAPGLMQQR
ncbi:hypothetical protein [Agrobacterium vitis]|uniref:hypothetical protein n=1 Tax=Agrobacterium vitis TaxID=373 RepID=UPI001571A166|nr:hypothetical protein [Agrobacterium vitis]NSZ52963.1 hypothetical protein [Agrobacterium vitis]NTA31722.1 hypothetical protein [Agrobacterium vitis]